MQKFNLYIVICSKLSKNNKYKSRIFGLFTRKRSATTILCLWNILNKFDSKNPLLSERCATLYDTPWLCIKEKLREFVVDLAIDLRGRSARRHRYVITARLNSHLCWHRALVLRERKTSPL